MSNEHGNDPKAEGSVGGDGGFSRENTQPGKPTATTDEQHERATLAGAVSTADVDALFGELCAPPGAQSKTLATPVAVVSDAELYAQAYEKALEKHLPEPQGGQGRELHPDDDVVDSDAVEPWGDPWKDGKSGPSLTSVVKPPAQAPVPLAGVDQIHDLPDPGARQTIGPEVIIPGGGAHERYQAVPPRTEATNLVSLDQIQKTANGGETMAAVGALRARRWGVWGLGALVGLFLLGILGIIFYHFRPAEVVTGDATPVVHHQAAIGSALKAEQEQSVQAADEAFLDSDVQDPEDPPKDDSSVSSGVALASAVVKTATTDALAKATPETTEAPASLPSAVSEDTPAVMDFTEPTPVEPQVLVPNGGGPFDLTEAEMMDIANPREVEDCVDSVETAVRYHGNDAGSYAGASCCRYLLANGVYDADCTLNTDAKLRDMQ